VPDLCTLRQAPKHQQGQRQPFGSITVVLDEQAEQVLPHFQTSVCVGPMLSPKWPFRFRPNQAMAAWQAERLSPWEWRRQGQPRYSTAPRPAASSGALTCGAKRSCREMASCAEARFYLQQCGLTRLDADRDGVPCEAICC
jgi:hypothetical protein